MNDTTSTATDILRKAKGGKYLSFFLDDEEYGLEILKVVEIIKVMQITKIPKTPMEVRGIINLRGKVFPVLELRLKFDMPTVEYTSETCIIVVQSQNNKIGIIVDKVSEVLNIADKDIEDTPNMGSKTANEYILGIGKTGERTKLLLDIDSVLSAVDMVQLTSTIEELEQKELVDEVTMV